MQSDPEGKDKRHLAAKCQYYKTGSNSFKYQNFLCASVAYQQDFLYTKE